MTDQIVACAVCDGPATRCGAYDGATGDSYAYDCCRHAEAHVVVYS